MNSLDFIFFLCVGWIFCWLGPEPACGAFDRGNSSPLWSWGNLMVKLKWTIVLEEIRRSPVEVVYPTIYRVFIHPRWLFGTCSINSMYCLVYPPLKLQQFAKIDGWKTIVSFWVSFLAGAVLGFKECTRKFRCMLFL